MKTVFLKEWRNRLIADDISIYRGKANNWLTCATGDRVLEEFGVRSKNYSDSLSGEARKIGNAFTQAVKDNDVKRALECIEIIEDLPSIWAGDVKPINEIPSPERFIEPPTPKPKKVKPKRKVNKTKKRKPRA